LNTEVAIASPIAALISRICETVPIAIAADVSLNQL
jgi:hypothetical protein